MAVLVVTPGMLSASSVPLQRDSTDLAAFFQSG